MFNFRFRSKFILTRCIRGTLATGFVLACLASTVEVGASQPRISTGKDLYEACKVLNDFALNPQGRTPRLGLYCRKFIGGYFTSLKFARGEGDVKSTMTPPIYGNDCVGFDGPRSYDQLAGQVVRSGEWHPELMGLPAVELAEKAFGTSAPCPR
ncbi:MAG: hypothetical protein WA138_01045 [Parvibaculum sp.]